MQSEASEVKNLAFTLSARKCRKTVNDDIKNQCRTQSQNICFGKKKGVKQETIFLRNFDTIIDTCSSLLFLAQSADGRRVIVGLGNEYTKN